MLLRMRKLFYKFVEKIKPHDLGLINFSRNRAVCVIMWKILLSRQGTARFACWIINVTHTHPRKNTLRMCNTYCFSTATLFTRKHHSVTLYLQCLYRSRLRSIAVHIHSVFCVLCTVCDNVPKGADTAILCGNCSAVRDAVSLQYTCSECSVSVTCTNKHCTYVRVRRCSWEKCRKLF
jgi:hypothetical protein